MAQWRRGRRRAAGDAGPDGQLGSPRLHRSAPRVGQAAARTSRCSRGSGAGRDLVDFLNAHPAHQIGAQLAGFGLVTLGSLVLAAALWRARAVPRAAIAAYVVLTAGLFLGLDGQVMNTIQTVQTLVLAALAIPLWQAASRR